MTVTPSEKDRLNAAGITDETLQRYAVWRRSTLLLVILPTLVSAVLASLDQGGDGLSRLGKLLTLVSTLILYAMPLSALAAACSWTRPMRSHQWLILGWLIAFLPPFALALTPIGWWFKEAPNASARMELATLDMLYGLYFYCTLTPTVLSLLPGLLRGCLRIKTLLPAAIIPGWFLVASAPFYLLLWLVVLIMLNHLAGNPLLVLGVLLWIGAPMLYVCRADLFIRPLTAIESRAIGRLGWLVFAIVIVAMALIVIYLLTKQVFGLDLLGLDAETSLAWLWQNHVEQGLQLNDIRDRARSLIWVGDLNLYQMTTEYLSRSLFVTAVFSDLLMRMNLSVWQHEKRFGREDEAAYEATMSAVEKAFGPKGGE